MIPQTDLSCQTETASESSWQRQMIEAVRNPEELCELLDITPEEAGLSQVAHKQFPLMVPRGFVNLMERGNPEDPLLKQVLNTRAEEATVSGFEQDPLNEHEYNPLPGLIHKYQGRVLLIVTGKCAINCRYCFRRNFPYSDNNPSKGDWQAAFDYIRRDKSLTEVILSGGDPLSAPDKHLSWLTSQLEQITHLNRLRIHTRLPVVIPERINAEMLDWLDKTRFKTQLILHINHPNEISHRLEQAIKKLRPLGITPLNQSVLLKGINDQLEILTELQEKAFSAGILPYYLFCMDRVAGAAHFDVPQEQAKILLHRLRAQLPGYLVPRLAVETPGEFSKTILI